jgi:RNA polymerase sigma-70 factor (ECF subfamily)
MVLEVRMSEPNGELLNRAVAGDRDALGQLLQQHGKHIAREILCDHADLSVSDVEDVIQVTFLEAFLHIRRFDTAAPGSIGGWLRSIARNNSLDLLRERNAVKRPPADRRITTDREASIRALLDQLSGSTGTPSQVAASTEMKVRLGAAVRELPESYQKVVQLYDLDGRSAEEVGESLGKSAGAIFMLRARAHERLKEILGAESQFFSRGA